MSRKYKVRSSDLFEDVDQLLYELCVNGGYCNQLNARDIIAEDGSINDQHFTICVLRAEGMEPTENTNGFDFVRKKFVERYGKWVSTKYYKYPK
jgi:hypothetical protein